MLEKGWHCKRYWETSKEKASRRGTQQALEVPICNLPPGSCQFVAQFVSELVSLNLWRSARTSRDLRFCDLHRSFFTYSSPSILHWLFWLFNRAFLAKYFLPKIPHGRCSTEYFSPNAILWQRKEAKLNFANFSTSWAVHHGSWMFTVWTSQFANNFLGQFAYIPSKKETVAHKLQARRPSDAAKLMLFTENFLVKGFQWFSSSMIFSCALQRCSSFIVSSGDFPSVRVRQTI